MANSNFYPTLAFIQAITNAQNATVTFTQNHSFTPGEIVSFRVGQPFGMSEINNIQARVLLTTPTTITVPVDTTTWNAFSLANLNQPGTSPPCCVPSSSGVIPLPYIPATNIFDAFDNVPI